MSKRIFIILLFFAFISASAQEFMPMKPIVCYGAEGVSLTEILDENSAVPAKRIAANPLIFSIIYDANFPEIAKPAFEKAAGIWSSYLTSSIPVHVKVSWQAFTGSRLAQTGLTKIYKNFKKTPYRNIWYVISLAEAISGTELNGSEDDITITLNSQIDWHYSTDGKAVNGKYDLVSVVFHELAHGLGFVSSFIANPSDLTQGQWGQTNKNITSATIYDVFIQDAQSKLLTNTSIYANPSTDLVYTCDGGNYYRKYKNL